MRQENFSNPIQPRLQAEEGWVLANTADEQSAVLKRYFFFPSPASTNRWISSR